LNLPEVKEALIDPNACWGKYDVVLCSPSVQSGVSYDVRDTFDAVFGMFGNSTNSSGDVCQMLCRVRHPKNNDVVVSFECNNGLISGNGGDITNRDEYIRYLSKVRNFGGFEQLNVDKQGQHQALENLTEFEFNTFNETEFQRNWFFNLYVDFKVAENADRQDFASNFINKQLLYGNKVMMFETKDITDNKIIKQEFVDTKQTRSVAHAHALDNAPNIDDDQAKTLKDKMRTSPSKHRG
jgi:hypothetical protein